MTVEDLKERFHIGFEQKGRKDTLREWEKSNQYRVFIVCHKNHPHSNKELSCSRLHAWRRQWHPTPVLLPGKSRGWRSLVGCSPWCRKESDMTEWLHFHFSLLCIGDGNGNPLQRSCLENPRDGEPAWLPSMGPHRVGHDWSDIAAAAAADYVHVHAQSLQSYLTLCDPMDSSLPGSSVHEILQATILEWVAMPSSKGSSWTWHWTCISCIAGGFLTHWTTWKSHVYIVILLNSWYSSLDLFIIFAYLYHVLLIIFINPKVG